MSAVVSRRENATPATRTRSRTTSRTAFRLLDLSDDLLAVVLDNCSDCVALVRLSQACRKLRSAAREDRIWRPVLIAFFDGQLPPSSYADVHALPALALLRNQVRFARQLQINEASLRRFQISESTSMRHFDRAQNVWVDVPGYAAWRAAADTRAKQAWDAKEAENKAAAEARGEEYRRPFGRVASAYCHFAESVQCYGEFARAFVACHQGVQDGAPRATFTHWVRLTELPDRLLGTRSYDYGLMSEFIDGKLTQIADQLRGDATAERARHRRRALEGHYDAVGGEEAQSGQAMPPLPDQLAPLTGGVHVHPKLLCGVYGGYFTVQLCSSNFGGYLTVGCRLDKTTRFTADYDNY